MINALKPLAPSPLPASRETEHTTLVAWLLHP
jgi:hypothetical protein